METVGNPMIGFTRSRSGCAPVREVSMSRCIKAFMLAALVLLVQSCDDDKQDYKVKYSKSSEVKKVHYVFGIHPLHNPARLLERYGPIIDYLNENFDDIQFTLEASRNYDEFDRKLYSRSFEFALPNPYQTVNALRHGYHVFGKMGDDWDFMGIILTRRDSNIRSVMDLKGKKISYPAKTALAATMMPQYFLYMHGLDVTRDVENLYVGSQESSIMNVYLGNVAAAATWPIPWNAFVKDQPEKAAALEVKWQTESLVNNSLMARDDIPPDVVAKVGRLFVALKDTDRGRAMLRELPISTFELANDATYDVIIGFLTDYSKSISPVWP